MKQVYKRIFHRLNTFKVFKIASKVHLNRKIKTGLKKKHKKENFIVPCSDIQRKVIPEQLAKFGIEFKNATLYKTVCSDLSDLSAVKYDMLVFYSPSGIQSLIKNFPGFTQNGTKIAVFGPTTAKAVEEAGFRIDVQAPSSNAPSMTMAIEQYLKAKK